MEPRPSEESIRAVRGITAALRANIDLMADEVRALETLREVLGGAWRTHSEGS